MGQLHGRSLVPVTAVVKQRENNFNGIIESCLLFSHSILLYSVVITWLLSINVLQSICISCSSIFQAALFCDKS